jgi:hypothetical protein
MMRGVYQISPCTRMELLHANIWWFEGLDLIKLGFTYSKGLIMYRKGIQCVDDVWDSERRDYLTWDKVQEKFKLTPAKLGD